MLTKYTHKNKIIAIAVILVPFVLFFLSIGIASAYDSWLRDQLNANLNNSVVALRLARQRCDSDYETLLKYKNENNLKLQGTGNPCGDSGF